MKSLTVKFLADTIAVNQITGVLKMNFPLISTVMIRLEFDHADCKHCRQVNSYADTVYTVQKSVTVKASTLQYMLGKLHSLRQLPCTA